MQTDKKIELKHEVGIISFKPNATVDSSLLKHLLNHALDKYIEETTNSVDFIHQKIKQYHGDYYRTSGYYLRLFRNRKDLTQLELAKKTKIKQHHISEMENNKRSIGKVLAKKIAKILNMNYKDLL